MGMTGRRRLDEVTAGDVMQKGVASVSPELTIAALDEILTGEEIGGAPVVDQDGGLQGVVSKTDIVRFLTTAPEVMAEDLLQGVTVAEIMTPDVLTVSEDESVAEIARKMVDASVHRILVMDGSRVLGIVTPLDLVRLLY